MGTFEKVSVPISVEEILLAPFDYESSTFEDGVVKVAGAQMIDLDFDVVSDQLYAGGKIVDIFSIVRGLTMNLKLAGVDRPAMNVLTGQVNNDNGNTTGDERGTSRQPAGGSGTPYFGFVGVHPTSDGGRWVTCVAGAKVDKPTPMSYDGENPQYANGTVPAKAIAVETHAGQGSMVIMRRWYEDASSFVEPTDGAEFLALFADMVLPPGPVTALTPGTATATTIPLTWTLPTTGGSVDHIRIEWNEDGSDLVSSAEVAGTATTYTIPGLTTATDYNIRVYAVNDGGDSVAATASDTTA